MEEIDKQEINIELKEEIGEGIFSNLAIVTHSHTEFILDFLRVMPGLPKAKVMSRIILTPIHAKRLLSVLKENIAKYELANGEKEINEDPPLPMNFGGPTAEA